MRTLNTEKIANAVAELCVEANRKLSIDLENCIKCMQEKETSEVANAVFEDMTENIKTAKELDIAICQDTGMAVVFIEVGQEVLLVGKSLEDAINEGVARGYTEGYLRCSVVSDPLERINTNEVNPVNNQSVASETVPSPTFFL